MVNLAQHVRKGAHRLAHVLEILRARSNDSPLKLFAARVTQKGVNLEQQGPKGAYHQTPVSESKGRLQL